MNYILSKEIVGFSAAELGDDVFNDSTFEELILQINNILNVLRKLEHIDISSIEPATTFKIRSPKS